MSSFQCFLIVGSEEMLSTEAQRIAAKLSIDIKKPSVDLFIVEPASAQAFGRGGHITIDQIREVKQYIFQKPIHLPTKIIILKKADRLTLEAQNALLKILEEPPQQAIIILLASDKKSLVPTILSRVITIQTKHQIKKYPPEHTSWPKENLLKLLQETSGIEDPGEWLDNQMVYLYQALVAKAKAQNLADLNQLTKIIERCAYTKKLIEANVNAKFAIFDLLFSLP